MANSPSVALHPADRDFFEPFYSMRCEKENIFWTGHDEAPDKNSLAKWFDEQLNKKNRYFFAIYANGYPAGYLYLDMDPGNEGTVEVSYGVSVKFAGQGIATTALLEAVKFARDVLSAKEAVLHIAEPNKASIRVAEKAGFIPKDRTKKIYYASAGRSFWLRRYHKPLTNESS